MGAALRKRQAKDAFLMYNHSLRLYPIEVILRLSCAKKLAGFDLDARACVFAPNQARQTKRGLSVKARYET
jgi:hypothetical protein